MFIRNGLWISIAVSSLNAIILNNSPPKITNRKLKSILNHACSGGENFSYHSKKVLYDRLKSQDIGSHGLADEILTISNNGLGLDFVLNLISEHFRGCPECHQGIMKKVDLNDLHSYDYDEYGILPLYCNNCGCGYRKYVITVTR